MDKILFSRRKALLLDNIAELLQNPGISEKEKTMLERVLVLLDHYSFENRLLVKGLLSHTVIDTLELPYSLGDLLIRFDHQIT
ncbi:hypothetical protein SAMN04488090_0742 [Siphonobacter aquaeclarae]|uniref:Uncharacterized protein n=1 Tax=Siphonobacter aquaeclarae TaxID=563176 RepID=A0A1G9JTE1_9BACT|nr:hypothetical protein SAMN04488090_0742 [Siphonobacter aquaeclarae]